MVRLKSSINSVKRGPVKKEDRTIRIMMKVLLMVSPMITLKNDNSRTIKGIISGIIIKIVCSFIFQRSSGN